MKLDLARKPNRRPASGRQLSGLLVLFWLYPCVGLFPAMYFPASRTGYRKLNPR